MWREVDVAVNGYPFKARYTDEAYERIFLPLLTRVVEEHRASVRPRTIVFLAGPPAAGKSTVARLLELFATDVPGCALQCVGLDGFHHYNDYLRTHSAWSDGAEVSLMDLKGTPESFDTERFAQKVDELCCGGSVPWPVYDRTIHDPREDAVTVAAPIVLIEGNWLLLDEVPWNELVEKADLTVMLRAEERQVRERAIARKAQGGMARGEAEAHYERTDGPNVRRVLGHSRPADVTMALADDGDLRILE